MKLFTYENKTTGRKGETLHAKDEAEVIKVMKDMGMDVIITDVFDPDAFLQTDTKQNKPTQQVPDTIQGQPINPIISKDIFFETNGIKFKIVNGVVFRKDWIAVTDKQDYKIVKQVNAKSNSVREVIMTDDVIIYRNDWVEVDHKEQ